MEFRKPRAVKSEVPPKAEIAKMNPFELETSVCETFTLVMDSNCYDDAADELAQMLKATQAQEVVSSILRIFYKVFKSKQCLEDTKIMHTL